jgi:hypothetical protein
MATTVVQAHKFLRPSQRYNGNTYEAQNVPQNELDTKAHRLHELGSRIRVDVEKPTVFYERCETQFHDLVDFQYEEDSKSK